MNRSSKLTGDKFESVKTYIIPSNLFWLLISINDNFYAEKKIQFQSTYMYWYIYGILHVKHII